MACFIVIICSWLEPDLQHLWGLCIPSEEASCCNKGVRPHSSPAEVEKVFDQIQNPFAGLEGNVFNLIKDIYKNPVANIILSGESACLLSRAPEKDSTSSPLSWRFWMFSLRLQKMWSIKSRKHSAFTADTVKIPELTPEFIVIQKTQNRQNNTEKNAGYLKRFQTSHPIRSGPECAPQWPHSPACLRDHPFLLVVHPTWAWVWGSFPQYSTHLHSGATLAGWECVEPARKSAALPQASSGFGLNGCLWHLE